MRLFGIPICEECLQEAMNFGVMALFGLKMSFESYFYLKSEEGWASSAPMTPQVVFAILVLTLEASAITGALALQCANQGCDAAAAGDSPHNHITEMIGWEGHALLHLLTYWAVNSTRLINMVAWH